MKLKDLKAREIQGTSRQITQEECKKVCPLEVPRKMIFMFKAEQVREFPANIGNFLIKKYSSIVLAEGVDNFDNMERADLYKIARSKGCDYDYIGTEREDFIEWLRST